MSRTVLLVHAGLAVVIVGAYTALTIAGHDGNALLALLGGQALGGFTTAVASESASPPK